jgi:hypothetical protein
MYLLWNHGNPNHLRCPSRLTDFNTAMSEVQSKGACDGVSALTDSLAELTQVATSLSVVFDTAETCPFLDIDTTSAQGINGKLSAISTNADKGCSTTAASESAMPQCMKDAAGIPNTSAAEGDGNLDKCELVLHCLGGSTSCFGN